MARILVTGGTGYIGSHTVVELFNAGYEVVIIDDLSNSNIRVLDQIEKISGKRPAFSRVDLCDLPALRKFAEQGRDITGIVHFAAFKAVGESVEQPLKYYRNNLVGLLNLLSVFPDTNLVFSSSCTVYGQPDRLPVTEKDPVKKAESPYGNTKQIAEEILEQAASATAGLKVIALRYFNPVGAHPSALIGELPLGVPQNLVPFITQSAIGLRGPVTVYGTDYNTPDGSAIRDYIHVTDVASAHVAAIRRLESGVPADPYEVFNIGTGTGYSVLEIIRAFEEATGTKLNYQLGARRPGDIEQIFGDVAKSDAVLNWKAAYSLKDMMSTAWQWEKYIGKNPFK